MYPCMNVTTSQPSQENLDLRCYGSRGYAGWGKIPRPGMCELLCKIDCLCKAKFYLVKPIFSCRIISTLCGKFSNVEKTEDLNAWPRWHGRWPQQIQSFDIDRIGSPEIQSHKLRVPASDAEISSGTGRSDGTWLPYAHVAFSIATRGLSNLVERHPHLSNFNKHKSNIPIDATNTAYKATYSPIRNAVCVISIWPHTASTRLSALRDSRSRQAWGIMSLQREAPVPRNCCTSDHCCPRLLRPFPGPSVVADHSACNGR